MSDDVESRDINEEKQALHPNLCVQPLDEARSSEPVSMVTVCETLEDVEINPAAASLIENHGNREQTRGAHVGVINTYTIDSCFQNTSENPYRETTVTVPHLLRKVPSEDLVPTGWKTINRIIVASYLSMFCCLLTGIIANHYAWEAKTDRSRGLYTLVQRQTKAAVTLIYVSVAIGAVLIIVIPVIVVCSVNGC